MGEESKESIADVEPSVRPEAFTDAIKAFIKPELLEGSYARRKEWIES